MFESLLIANRGEIARRVIRTARRMGIRTLAVYSEADANALHVREADAAGCIGPAPAAKSYLQGEVILDAARKLGAQAIHPGYGFLSENAGFAQAVIDAGLIWVGPPPTAILAMGLKDSAKARMAAAGVAVTPGYLGEDQSDETLARQGAAIGWPLLIKAVAGGGGKGMRRVDGPQDFASALSGARREAAAAFGDDRVLLEKYVTSARHIEVQIFTDRFGHAVHLYERDCSLQRRHQKVIEEAPAPGMDEATRTAVCAAAVKAALAVGYEGAGTVEFIADASQGLRADRIWFMEMNTRLQVEHPVTEAVTGLDLVEWQLRVAAGEALPLRQDEIALNGHAVEARLYAEDPAAGFLPSMGRLHRFEIPTSDVRVDTGVEAGSVVTPHYDPMLAKIIAWSPTRRSAVSKLAKACAQIQVWPVKTNAGFLARCLEAPDFVEGKVDTAFIPDRDAILRPVPDPSEEAVEAVLAAEAALLAARWPPPHADWTGFRLNAPPSAMVSLWRGAEVRAALVQAQSSAMVPVITDAGWLIFERGEAFEFSRSSLKPGEADTVGDGALRSPMPGKIAQASLAVGAVVTKGQVILVLEAMKMEHSLTAPTDGVLIELNVTTGQQVKEGLVLARIEPKA